MRGVLLLGLLGLFACDSGVVEIDGVGGEDETDALVDDTEPAGGDTDVVVDTEVPADTDGGGPGPVDTDATSPFDAPRLAWDGKVVHTFVGYAGAPYGCEATLLEQGEELASADVTAGLRAACPACQRFFEVRVQTRGVLCIQDWKDLEWRAVEVRPTGTARIVEIYTGQGGGPVPREPYPNVAVSGDTLSWKLRRSGFPIYQTEKVDGEVVLTPLP